MSFPEGNILTAMFQFHINDTEKLLPITQTLNAVAVAINVLIGLPIHTCVIWLIFTGNGAASEVFALNLATSEVVFCLGSIVYLFRHQSLLECMYFFTVFLFIARPLFQSYICVERYLAVIEPVLFLKLKPLRYRLVVSALGWLIALTCCFVAAFQNLVTVLLLMSIVNIVLLLLMLFCSLTILKALTEPGPGEGRREVGRANQANMKAFKIILVLLLSLLFNDIIGITGIVTFFTEVGIEVKIYYYNTIFFIMIFTGFIQPLLYTKRKLPCIPTLAN